MAIRIRRGNQVDFDKNKLVQGELAIVLDAGELHFCYGAGNTKKLMTAEDLQDLLNASPEAYQALQQLIADLTADPNELANILSNISALQAGKIDKASIVNNDTTGGVDKVASAEVVKVHGQEIDTLTNNLGDKFPNNAGAHNSIFRGKYLGSSVTATQYTAISSGSFEDLYIGDYWTIGEVNWRIAAFNYYRNTGDTNVPGNHLVIVPDQSLYIHVMNDTNTTDGGYTGSKMYTEGLEQAKTIINNAFSGHVVTFRTFLCNSVTNGRANGGVWVDSTVDLMNEIMVYGSVVNGAAIYGMHNIGAEKSQLPLFALNPQSINTRYSYWLKDIASATYFAYVSGYGGAGLYYASYPLAVRPRFLIS